MIYRQQQPSRQISQTDRENISNQEDILLQNDQKNSKCTFLNSKFCILVLLVFVFFTASVGISVILFQYIEENGALNVKLEKFGQQKLSDIKQIVKEQSQAHQGLMNSQIKNFQLIVDTTVNLCKQSVDQYKRVSKSCLAILQLYNHQFNTIKFYSDKLQSKPTSPAYIPSFKQLQNLIPQNDIIIVTHAGRQRYLQILYKHLLKAKLKGQFSKWHLWMNTNVRSQFEFMRKLQQENSDWIKIIYLASPQPNYQKAFARFYRQDCQKNKIYLKLDDDIVWMQDNFIEKMFKARFRLNKNLLVFANIINTAVHTSLQQKLGVFKYPQTIQYDCLGNGWSNPEIGVAVHKQFQKSIQHNQVNKWKSFRHWQATDYERISINAFIYYSETIRQLEFALQGGDQVLYSMVYPKLYNMPNIIIGDAICVHGAFFIQRPYFDQNHPQILQKYKQFADRI